MRKKTNYIKIIILTLLLTACSEPSIQYLKTQTPKFDIKDFFRGKIIGSGLIQNWRGEVIKTFTVTTSSFWSDNTATIIQNITFNNGATLNRNIKITITTDGKFLIDASDIYGTGIGAQSGNSASFSYDLLVPYMKGEISLSASEWLYMLPDHSVIANITLRKFGIKLGEIIFHMRKTSETEGKIVPNHKQKRISSE